MTQTRLLKAFFHKSRKTYPAWTAAELSRRANIAPNMLRPLLAKVRKEGLAAKITTNTPFASAWELTELGQQAAADALAKETPTHIHR